MANFNITTGTLSPAVANGATDTAAILIADINQLANTISWNGNQAALLDAVWRSADIGGLVWTPYWRLQPTYGGEINAGEAAELWETLYVDRLDVSGSPASGVPPWELTMPPVATGSTVTDDDFPTRVLQRRMWDFHAPASVVATDTSLATAYRSLSSGRLMSKKLRLKLGDQHGLFLSYTLRSNSSVSQLTAVVGVWGALYWRVGNRR